MSLDELLLRGDAVKDKSIFEESYERHQYGQPGHPDLYIRNNRATQGGYAHPR